MHVLPENGKKIGGGGSYVPIHYSNNQISKYSDSSSSRKIGIIHYSNNIGPSPQRRERVEELRALLALDIEQFYPYAE